MQMWLHIFKALIQFGGLHFERIVAVPSDTDLHSFTFANQTVPLLKAF